MQIYSRRITAYLLGALRYGEYRESVDIDFLVSDLASYRHLRNLVREQGLQALILLHNQ